MGDLRLGGLGLVSRIVPRRLPILSHRREVLGSPSCDGHAASWPGRGRAQETALAEGDPDEPPRRDTGEGVLARLRRADEEGELLLLVARREVRVAVEDQDRGAVVPGELFR